MRTIITPDGAVFVSPANDTLVDVDAIDLDNPESIDLSDVINLPDISDVSFPTMIGAIPSKPPTKKRRRRPSVKYRGVDLSRQPTDFEAAVISLSEIPRRFDMEVDRVVEEIRVIRRAQLDGRMAGQDLAETAGVETFAALHAAQDRMRRYGAFELRQECARQGLKLAVPADDAPLYALADDKPLRGVLDQHVFLVAKKLHDEWVGHLSQAMTRAEMRRRKPASVLALAESKMLWGVKAQVRALLNTTFAMARREEMATVVKAARRDPALSLARGGIPRTVDEDDLEDLVDYVVQTAIMDTNTCDPCAEADGLTFDYDDDDMLEYQPPYYKCEGGDNCRCVQVYVLKTGGSWVVR